MNSPGFRMISLLLAAAGIVLGSALIMQSYSRMNLSSGLGGNLHVAQMEMISGAVVISGGLISLSILAASSIRVKNSDDR